MDYTKKRKGVQRCPKCGRMGRRSWCHTTKDGVKYLDEIFIHRDHQNADDATISRITGMPPSTIIDDSCRVLTPVS